MEVLLLQDVRGIGRRMEVKKVAEGYARNFLIPRKFAIPMGPEAKTLKAKAQIEERALQSKTSEMMKRLEAEAIEFIVKTGAHGEVFGSVKGEDIEEAFKKKGFGEVHVKLEKPIRVLGEHAVSVDFGHGTRGQAKIIVKG